MTTDKNRRDTGWRADWPLWSALGLFLLIMALMLAAQVSSGRILLAEEDAYQRLAVAKSLADRFAWEILPGEFTSAFGTLLWPLFLAPVFLLLGANALWPWLLNALLSLVLIVLAYQALRESIASPAAQAVLLAVMVVGLPLAPLAAAGMEQVLFLVLMLIFLRQWARRMQDPSGIGLLPMAATALLLASTRYEGLLLVAFAAGFLLMKRDFAAGILLPCAAALPLGVFGIISWRAGWLPVPASVYLRRAELIPSDLSQWPSVVFRSLSVLSVNPEIRAMVFLLALLPAWLGLTDRLTSIRERAFHRPALALLTMLAYLTLVGDRGYRYDAWLILFGGWAALPALGKLLPADFRDFQKQTVTLLAGGALAILLAFPLVNRGVQGTILFARSVERTKWFGYLASIWATDCAAGALATDSPGMIAFFSPGVSVVDLSGFVSLNAFRERRKGDLQAEWMAMEAERIGVSAAVIFHPSLQSQAAEVWTSAGGWSRESCIGCGSVEIFQGKSNPDQSICTERFLTGLAGEGLLLKPGTGAAK